MLSAALDSLVFMRPRWVVVTAKGLSLTDFPPCGLPRVTTLLPCPGEKLSSVYFRLNLGIISIVNLFSKDSLAAPIMHFQVSYMQAAHQAKLSAGEFESNVNWG